MTMLVKVCGMRDAENIRELETLGIDWIGMIFWPKSKRYVAQRPAYLPEKTKRVGVFVNSHIEDILQHVEDYGLDFIQLHGSESPTYITSIRTRTKAKIIKVFNIANTDDLLQVQPYEGIADYYLFDTKGKAIGGNGEKFDWSVLATYQGNTPFLLSGGIGPDDAEHIGTFHHPKCIGIDLNSRFETEPALKNVTQLKHFLEQLKK